MHPDYKILQWDTDFFGFTVANILPHRLGKYQLENILAQLRRQGVTLAYWASDPADRESQDAGSSFNGFLADMKVTYKIDLKNLPKIEAAGANSCVEEFSGKSPDPELEKLAIQAGAYSRFNVDPKIGKERFKELYLLWIKKSVKKTMADCVLVFKEGGTAVGMVTLSGKDGYGSIGLLAVDGGSRGNKIGQRLLRAAQDWFIKNNYSSARVQTQVNNKAGCRLYEKCGFCMERTEYFYHFWL